MLANLVPNVLLLLANPLLNEISTILGVDKEIRKLKRNLEQMMDILADAEKKQSQDAATKHWMKQLKDNIYSADDIIDTCIIEAEKRKCLKAGNELEHNLKFPILYWQTVVFRQRIARRIQELDIDMKHISDEHTKMQSHRDDLSIRSSSAPGRYCESDIVGAVMQDTAHQMIQALISEESKTFVFALVGMVGIGKTTLAREIYHDKKTRDCFNTRLWVCVSTIKDYSTVSSKLLIYSGDSSATESLENIFNNLVRRKKRFLLVLDDVRYENIREHFLDLHLRGCLPGSRVLVTTRHEHIAKRMDATIQHVQQLHEDDGLLLLRKRALLEEREFKAVEGIGKKLVEKFNGVPMGIERMGHVLRVQQPLGDEWNTVYRNAFRHLSDLEQEAVIASYQDMSSSQKKCFMYCSLFPEEFQIEKRYITQQWISEGFFHEPSSLTLEEQAEQCYQELIARSVLQLVPEKKLECHTGETAVTMPNILRCFAQEISRDENCEMDPQLLNDGYGLRRMLLTSTIENAIPEGVKKLKNLRTLLFFNNRPEKAIADLQYTLRKLTLLRVLDLHNTKIDAIPDSLGRLQHLRYLNLSNTGIRRIPESIRQLKLLQFLILRECRWLHSLPLGIEQLSHMRCLDVLDCGLEKFKMHLSKLKDLNRLQGFLVDNSAASASNPTRQLRAGWQLEELKDLTKLTSLQMLNLEHAIDLNDANNASLFNKTTLKELELRCSKTIHNPKDQDITLIEQIFDKLRPPASLVSLKLLDFYGQDYPQWMFKGGATENLTLDNLRLLHLEGSSRCKRLPPLGLLPKLERLTIQGHNSLEAIDHEFRGGNAAYAAFPKLEQLEIKHMLSLESWAGLQKDDLPCLKKFLLEKCHKLRDLPEVIKQKKEIKLEIIECESFQPSTGRTMVKSLDGQQSARSGNRWKTAIWFVVLSIFCFTFHIL